MSNTNKMKYAKIKQENGEYSALIPIGVNAQNVDLPDGRTLEQIVDNLLEYDDFARPFSASVAYDVGDYVFYNDNLYRFKQAHSVNAAWSDSPDVVDTVILADDLAKMIEIKTGQPTDNANKLWINPNGDSNIEIVTYDEFKNFEKNVIAQEFSPTEAYAEGDYVIFEDKFYVFTKDHAKNISWNVNNDVQELKIGNELKRIEAVVRELQQIINALN